MTTTSTRANNGRAVDPSQLESLGKTAARFAETGDLSLTDAVVQTVGREDLNPEQVRRVVEYANTEAFNRKFASTAGSMRAVHIDGGPADPVSVLQSLNNAARPREVVVDSFEYSMPPDFGKESSLSFSSTDRTSGGVLKDVDNLQRQLASAHDELTQGMEASKAAMNGHLVELGDYVKRASLQGATPSDIISAWAQIHPEMAKTALARTQQFMRTDNVKVAGRSINPAHPVVQQFDAFVKAASSYAAHHDALMSTERELVKVSAWLRRHGRSS